MSTKIDVINGELAFVIKKDKKLKLKNKDSIKYDVEITPPGFSKEGDKFQLKKKGNLSIKADGSVTSGKFYINFRPKDTSDGISNKRKGDDEEQNPPRMIIKVG